MLARAVDLIGEQRAAGASLFPLGAEHEVIDDELAASVEQIGERHAAAVGGFEDVVLLDLDPGQRAALFRQAVALARPGLLLGEKRAARLEPLLLRDNVMLAALSGHGDLLSMRKWRSSLSSAPFQPSSWLRRVSSSCRREWMKMSSVPSTMGRSSISTSDSPGSSPPTHRQVIASRCGRATSRYSPLLSCSLPSSMRKRTR